MLGATNPQESNGRDPATLDVGRNVATAPTPSRTGSDQAVVRRRLTVDSHSEAWSDGSARRPSATAGPTARCGASPPSARSVRRWRRRLYSNSILVSGSSAPHQRPRRPRSARRRTPRRRAARGSSAVRRRAAQPSPTRAPPRAASTSHARTFGTSRASTSSAPAPSRNSTRRTATAPAPAAAFWCLCSARSASLASRGATPASCRSRRPASVCVRPYATRHLGNSGTVDGRRARLCVTASVQRASALVGQPAAQRATQNQQLGARAAIRRERQRRVRCGGEDGARRS